MLKALANLFCWMKQLAGGVGSKCYKHLHYYYWSVYVAPAPLFSKLNQSMTFYYSLRETEELRPRQVDSQFIVPAPFFSLFTISHLIIISQAHFIYVWEVFTAKITVWGTNGMPSLRITQNSQQTFRCFYKSHKWDV